MCCEGSCSSYTLSRGRFYVATGSLQTLESRPADITITTAVAVIEKTAVALAQTQTYRYRQISYVKNLDFSRWSTFTAKLFSYYTNFYIGTPRRDTTNSKNV